MSKIYTISADVWGEVLKGDEWFYLVNPEKYKGVLHSVKGKNHGTQSVTSPILNSDDKDEESKAIKRVLGWMEENVFLLHFGYKRCALVDPEFPKGIIVQDRDKINVVKWNSYAEHGLRVLAMGKETGGIVVKAAGELLSITKDPTNGDIADKFREIEGLMGVILSCVISEQIEEAK